MRINYSIFEEKYIPIYIRYRYGVIEQRDYIQIHDVNMQIGQMGLTIRKYE